jgi:hypothetical protein
MLAELLAEWTPGCNSLPPSVKPILPLRVVAGSRKKMSLRAKVSRKNAVDFEKALRMLSRFEAFHPALSLSGRLMRVLRAVVQVSVLPMSHESMQECGAITLKQQVGGGFTDG